MKELLDTYLLELILMDTAASSRGRCIPGAERIIQRSFPPGLYDCIMQRYDELSDDQDDSNPHFLDPWLRMAANQNPRWKRKMILRFLCIMHAGGPIGRAELSDVAVLAAAMGASREYGQALCSAIHINRRSIRATGP
jgi:hypothetical protein